MATTYRHSGIGAVCAGHAETARVGARILEQGGNAVDAVVAMLFAGAVVEGTLSTLGGGGFMIVSGPGLRPQMVEFFVRQPGLGARPFLSPWEVHRLALDGTVLEFGTGPASAAVPMLPRGLAHCSAMYGQLPLTAVALPAAELASDGVVLTRTQAVEHHMNVDLFRRDPEGGEIYAPGGKARAEGEVFRQPLLAQAIEEIAATQARTFYEGDIARRLVEWSDRRGGRISREDLLACQVHQYAPLTIELEGVTVHTNPPPAMGGTIIARVLERMIREVDPAHTHDEHAARVIADVLRELRPPLTRPPVAGTHVHTGDMSADLHEAVSRLAPDRGGSFSKSPNTTHVAAIDSDGMVASSTTTCGYGAGEFIPGTGIQLNNVLAEYDHTAVRPPGATVPSMMSPSILEGGRALVAIGSAGSDRIPQAISQILRRMFGESTLGEAVGAPRFVYDGEGIHCEPGFGDLTLEALERDFTLTRWSDRDAYFGTSNAVAVRDGELQACGDPRREAAGIVLE